MTVAGRFVSYLRVSTEGQGRSGLGLEAQRKAVADFLNGGRWQLVSELVEVESGKRADRPKLADALRLCRLQNATLVIAKLDRLSRDAHFLLGLQKAGVRFVAADMPEANEMVVGIMAVVAQAERQMISARTKAALQAARARGVKLGKPDNLRRHDEGRQLGRAKRSEIAAGRAEDLAPIIADLRAAGAVSLREIAAGLNERGIPTAWGRSWAAVTVARVLARLEGHSRAEAPSRARLSLTTPASSPALPPGRLQPVATVTPERTAPPRRNRVNPFGLFDATEARGALMGNRGRLHDAGGQMTAKTHNHRNWIICQLHFRGRQRTINAPGQYTELFALDEATFMAAGHRVCAECQRDRYSLFKAAWRAAHNIDPAARFLASEIDAQLHAARIDAGGRQITHRTRLADLPAGVIVVLDEAPERPALLWRGLLHPWSHEGYGAALDAPPAATVTVLTPAPLVRTIAAGYTPAVACEPIEELLL